MNKHEIRQRVNDLHPTGDEVWDEDKWQTYLMDYTLNRAHLGGYDEVFWRISLSHAYCKFREIPGNRRRTPNFGEMKECLTGQEYDDLVRTWDELTTLAEELKDDALRVYQTTRSWHLTPEEEAERKRIRDKRKPLTVEDVKKMREVI